uniref:hypothetical protein n=1 Tax=Rhodococcus hoagii TaxID=43767 RepID=UPI00155DA025|nr:hypothetical protein [Prescottella equi]
MNLAIESSGTPTDELFNNLSNILSTVAWAGMALGFLIMVVSAGRLAFAYDSYARSSALRGIIGGVGHHRVRPRRTTRRGRIRLRHSRRARIRTVPGSAAGSDPDPGPGTDPD